MPQIKVLVVDDSPLFRGVTKRILRSMPRVGEIEVARDGIEALEAMERFKPNLVLLDLQMPKLGGIGTLRIARKRFPRSNIIMLSKASGSAADLTVRALEAGALDFICKPGEGSAEASDKYLKEKLAPFVSLAAERLKIDDYREEEHPSPEPSLKKSSAAHDLVAIGASTGAPGALVHVVPRFPRSLSVPVLVVVHLPAAFSRSLARQLSSRSVLPVVVPEHGDLLLGGRVYIAPGDRHIRIIAKHGSKDKHIHISQDGDSASPYRPSFDILLQSIARLNSHCLAVVMTGMGSDGKKGVAELKEQDSGHYCLVQSSDSCVVSSMPDAIVAADLADEEAHLDDIPRRILRLVGE